MAIDLTGVINVFEGEMVDTFQAFRDSESTDDDVLNEETGELERPEGDESSLFDEPASGMLVPLMKTTTESEQGGTRQDIISYTLWLELGTPELLPEDRVVLVTSDRWPDWNGEELIVNDTGDRTTFPVGHKYEVRKKQARDFPRER